VMTLAQSFGFGPCKTVSFDVDHSSMRFPDQLAIPVLSVQTEAG
jgi:hypothetical protein